jgi:ribosomal protein S16
MLKKKIFKQKIIRFKKRGKIHYPLYDIVVTFKNNKNKGYFIEKLGFLNPNLNNKIFFINSLRLSK